MDISGLKPQRFARVTDAFADNFAQNLERGARFSVVQDGELVLDIWGGFADRDHKIAFTDTILTPVFSTGKAVMAMMMARLVDQGKLDYDKAVAHYWPQFGQAGKSRITVAMLLSHQAGLSGFSPPQEPLIWFDIEATLKALCEQAPLWTPGQGSGYHPIAGGYLIGELFRLIDGRSLGTALKQDFALPFGLDLMIGTPDSEFSRIAEMQKPPSAPDLGVIDEIKRAAFLDKGSSPAGKGSADWRRMEIPSANTHATALGLAHFMAMIANDGQIRGRSMLSKATLEQAMKERVCGQDRVLPFKLSWAAGLLRNKGIHIYGPNDKAVGHSGWGGSCAFADPHHRLSVAYVMNKQSASLIGDPRPLRLIDALYRSL